MNEYEIEATVKIADAISLLGNAQSNLAYGFYRTSSNCLQKAIETLQEARTSINTAKISEKEEQQ